MSNFLKQLSAYFLLLCLVASLIPFNVFHDHATLEHCDATDVKVETNPCHVSLYHAQADNEDSKCDHNTHLNEAITDCDFCQFFNSQRHTYYLVQSDIVDDLLPGQEQFTFENTYQLSDANTSTLGRAPPTC